MEEPRMKEPGESQAVPPTEEAQSRTREAIKALQEKLRRQEAKEVTGAVGMTPKTRMMDARAIEAQHPDRHFRYVNQTDPAKVQLRRDRGYEPVSEAEAAAAGVSARLGTELVLMSVPRQKFDEQVEKYKKAHEARLQAHKADVTKAAEAIVRELKDKHGLNVPMDRLLVDESS